MPTDRLAAGLVLLLSLSSPCDAQLPDEGKPAPSAGTPSSPGRMTKSIKETWKDVKVAVLRPGRPDPETVNARRAIYELDDEGRSTTIPVVALVAPASGTSWVGPEQDLYLETETGIVGFDVLGGSLIWCESLLTSAGRGGGGRGVKATQKEAPEIAADFERNVTGTDLRNAIHPVDRKDREATVTRLRPAIKNPWMFTNGPLSSQGGTPKIVRAELAGKTVLLELTDQTGEFQATVWVDIETRKVTKVEEGPWETFPKRR